MQRVFLAETADAWFTRRNDAPPFFGHTPLAYALRHGLTGLFTVRNELGNELGAAAHGTLPTTPENRRVSLLPQPDFNLGPD